MHPSILQRLAADWVSEMRRQAAATQRGRVARPGRAGRRRARQLARRSWTVR